MLFNSELNLVTDRNHHFDHVDAIVCFLQDKVHIGTKLRNRLLNTSAVLLIGNKITSISHLKMLINTVSKDIHGLVYSDICPDDRQNFGSLQKIIQPKVTAALTKHIVDSEGTIEYIRICQEIISSLYDDDLPPLERIFLIWRSTFFLRACRLFITKMTDTNINLTNNFITSNAYLCIELNAENLIILTKKFRDEDLEKCFVPAIFNSQPCEETFRKLRSMGTINYTKINFTLLQLLHLISRVELMNDIMHFKLADDEIFFPRNPLKRAKENQFGLPSDIEIKKTVSRALMAAVEDAKKFGMCVSKDDIANCVYKYNPLVVNQDHQNEGDEFVDLGIAHNDDLLEYENLKDYQSDVVESPDEASRFVNVVGNNGIKTVRKTSMIWALTGSKEKLSTDRLKRVRGSSNKTNPYRRLEFVDVSMINQTVYKSNEIKIGDWCVFNNQNDENEIELLVGNVLSFRYVGGKVCKDNKYSSDFASVEEKMSEGNSREIETLASWYQIEMSGITSTLKHTKNSFIHLKYYVGNVSRDMIEKQQNETICLSQKLSESIKNILQSDQ